MRIAAKPITPAARPRFGDVRVVRKFLLLPRKMRNPENRNFEWRWLETAHWREECRQGVSTIGWETVSEWVDKDIPLMSSLTMTLDSTARKFYGRRDLEGLLHREKGTK